MATSFNIALVNDQQMTRITLGTFLEKRLNVNVVMKAANGKELLHFLKMGQLPDLIITDLAMPHMDGLTLCKKSKHFILD